MIRFSQLEPYERGVSFSASAYPMPPDDDSDDDDTNTKPEVVKHISQINITKVYAARASARAKRTPPPLRYAGSERTS